VLYSVYEPKQTVHGFVASRSILTNAEKHVRRRFVLNIDLEDFFHTIHFGRVQGMFMKPPYNLPQEVSKVLAQICCYDGRLPQGAPTSPIVSNMICARMDSELRKLAKACKCTYTRYADDITFSTTLPSFPSGLASYTDGTDLSNIILGERLKLTIQGNGFEVNEDKTRLQHKSGHQGVTGLTVNQFPNVRRSFVREISSMLYEWQKCIELGTSIEQRYKERRKELLEESLQELPLFKVNPLYQAPSFRQVLRGKIMFLGMIKGKQNPTYLTYLKWFNQLSEKN
jgi:RNA-directed DNA polymerase